MSRLLFFPLLALSLHAAALRPADLRCEYRRNPLGIDVTQPRLSWLLQATPPTGKNLHQSAYRILAASSEALLAAHKADLWDTGKIDSSQSVHVPWTGKPLASGQRVFWKVQVWDQAGAPAPWSPNAHFSLGLLSPADWKAQWIGLEEPTFFKHPASPFHQLSGADWIWTAAPLGARHFRKSFELPPARRVRSARLVITADQNYRASLNGHRFGRGHGAPMPETYDLAEHLRTGENTLTVEASTNRKQGGAGLLAALHIEFTEGPSLIVKSDRTWEAAESPNGPWASPRVIAPYGAQPWGEIGFSEERVLPARYLRKEFTARAAIRRATVYFSGLGSSELYVNGSRIGDDVLSPALTEYEKRVPYVTHDVTRHLTAGRNALGVILGNGRYWAPREKVPIPMRTYGTPRLRLQLVIEYANNTTETLVSDASWKVSASGPIRANNEFDGEEYDARLEFPNWSRPAFNDASWKSAETVAAPQGPLVAQMAEPLRVTETLKPVSVTERRPGVFIVDFGQNLVGWTRLRVSGPKGTTITIRHAESLAPDGSLYVENLRSARATDTYTLKGGAPETWEPRFTYHGFRYAEVRGWPGALTAAMIDARVVHDAMTPTASFETSDALLNRLHRNIYWGVRGNYRSIPTDCPQRDERMGWLGDRSVVSRGESYLFDIAAFYSKWMTDLADSQKDSGSLPNVAPAYWVLYSDNITWPSTFVILPGVLYDQYGDRRILERDYPAMKKWITYMSGFLKDGLMPRDTYGDWCVPPEKPDLIHSQDPARKTDGTLLGTAYFYQMLRLMARYARILESETDAKEFEALSARMKQAFLAKYFKPESAQFDNGTQTSSILPLAFGLVPPAEEKRVFDALVRKIETESNSHVGVGLVGAQWLMRTLTENGRPDLAFTIATQKSYPGWGYMIEKGATTIWELWNGDTADPAMNSGNHVMQIGDLNVWFYEYLAGIRPGKPGFEQIEFRPVLVPQLNFVKASHLSPYGLIKSEWRREGGTVKFDITVPPNSTALLHLPGLPSQEVGSGTHSFTATVR